MMINSAKNFLDNADLQLTGACPETLITASPNQSIEERLPIHSPLGTYFPLPVVDNGAWSGPIGDHSLPEAYESVDVSYGENVPKWKTMSAFCGPGAMIAVGEDKKSQFSLDSLQTLHLYLTTLNILLCHIKS